jgi:class 3 adenylate cyclase/pimeloyl-ACP methyl ester carboxylesterase
VAAHRATYAGSQMDVPEIRYAVSGDVHIAYQTWGSGPALVTVPPFVQNVESLWQDPTGYIPRFLERCGSFATVTHFDKRGTGLSDRVPGFVGIEARMDDFRAVMDDAGIERAAVGGISEGGPMAMLFAATYPERVDALLLYGTAVRFVQGDGYPFGRTDDEFQVIIEVLAATWATDDSPLLDAFMPSMANDQQLRKWEKSYCRACASPGSVRDILEFVRTIDVRDILPSIRVPTLIGHRTGDLIASIDHARYLAEHIDGARFVEFPGEDHLPWGGDQDAFLDVVEEFLTGRTTRRVEPNRVLATVLFTDIVGSTELASQLGDREWHQVLDRHDRLVRHEVDREGGRLIKSTGDGILATFDSPSGAVRAAISLGPALKPLGIDMRAGLHTGEVELRGDDVAGVAVHVASRVESMAAPGEILTTTTVRDLVLGSPFCFSERGSHALKGVPGTFQLLTVS